MLSKFEAWKIVKIFNSTREILTMADDKKWWRKGSKEEDEVVADAAHELIDSISNADLVRNVKGHTDIDLRDQVTVEEVEDWARDRDLRRFSRRN